MEFFYFGKLWLDCNSRKLHIEKKRLSARQRFLIPSGIGVSSDQPDRTEIVTRFHSTLKIVVTVFIFITFSKDYCLKPAHTLSPSCHQQFLWKSTNNLSAVYLLVIFLIIFDIVVRLMTNFTLVLSI